MPEEILYDNQKVVVLGRSADGARLSPGSSCLRRPVRLQAPPLPALSGQDQGQGGALHRLCPGPLLLRTHLHRLADLNHQLEHWLASVANVREHRTTGERPCDRLLREKLLPFAAARPWRSAQTPVAPPGGPPSASPLRRSERRSLSVYEEVCS